MRKNILAQIYRRANEIGSKDIDDEDEDSIDNFTDTFGINSFLEAAVDFHIPNQSALAGHGDATWIVQSAWRQLDLNCFKLCQSLDNKVKNAIKQLGIKENINLRKAALANLIEQLYRELKTILNADISKMSGGYPGKWPASNYFMPGWFSNLITGKSAQVNQIVEMCTIPNPYFIYNQFMTEVEKTMEALEVTDENLKLQAQEQIINRLKETLIINIEDVIPKY